MSRILRAAQVADRLGVAESTIWRWAAAGLLPPRRRIGPKVTGWIEDEISEFIGSCPILDDPNAQASVAAGDG